MVNTLLLVMVQTERFMSQKTQVHFGVYGLIALSKPLKKFRPSTHVMTMFIPWNLSITDYQSMKGWNSMNGLTIIYIIGALAIGVLIGMTTEVFIDAKQIRSLFNRINTLELEKEALTKEHREDKVEIITLPKADRTYHEPW